MRRALKYCAVFAAIFFCLMYCTREQVSPIDRLKNDIVSSPTAFTVISSAFSAGELNSVLSNDNSPSGMQTKERIQKAFFSVLNAGIRQTTMEAIYLLKYYPHLITNAFDTERLMCQDVQVKTNMLLALQHMQKPDDETVVLLSSLIDDKNQAVSVLATMCIHSWKGHLLVEDDKILRAKGAHPKYAAYYSAFQTKKEQLIQEAAAQKQRNNNKKYIMISPGEKTPSILEIERRAGLVQNSGLTKQESEAASKNEMPVQPPDQEDTPAP